MRPPSRMRLPSGAVTMLREAVGAGNSTFSAAMVGVTVAVTVAVTVGVTPVTGVGVPVTAVTVGVTLPAPFVTVGVTPKRASHLRITSNPKPVPHPLPVRTPIPTHPQTEGDRQTPCRPGPRSTQRPPHSLRKASAASVWPCQVSAPGRLSWRHGPAVSARRRDAATKRRQELPLRPVPYSVSRARRSGAADGGAQQPTDAVDQSEWRTLLCRLHFPKTAAERQQAINRGFASQEVGSSGRG